MGISLTLRLVGRFTWRDWRAGELTVLGLALILAIAALSSVDFLGNRLQRGLAQGATQLLGADLVISADRPLPSTWQNHAQQLGLQAIQSISFPSMASTKTAQPTSKLVALLATETAYPLRGQLRVRTPSTNLTDERSIKVQQEELAQNEVWVDSSLLRTLNLQLGDALQLGEKTFTIRHEITYEGPRDLGFSSFAPRVVIRLEDLPATQLLQAGSRATWRLWVARSDNPSQYASTDTLSTFQSNLAGQLGRGQKLETVQDGRPEIRNALERAERFLGLVAVLAALLAAVAIAIAAQHFAERHLDAYALMRCLGLTANQLTRILLGELLLLGILAASLGSLLGWGVQYALLSLTAQLFPTKLPAPSLWPLAQAIVSGCLLLLTVSMPTLYRLRQIPPVRVIRRAFGPTKPAHWLSVTCAVAVVASLIFAYAGNLQLGLILLAGVSAGLLLFYVFASALLSTLRVFGKHLPARGLGILQPILPLRQILQGMTRRRGETRLQIIALAIGLFALLLLGVTRTDLLNAWRAATPQNAPNRFVINLQVEQRAAFSQALAQIGLATPTYQPMIRGRLIGRNQHPINPSDFTDEQARRLLEREFNLSYMDTLPSHNSISSGTWFDATQPSAELSLEAGLAKTLQLQLGDILEFDIAGTTIQARVTSLRKLRWDSMQVNFFVIMPRHLLQDMPQTFISAFYVPPAQARQVDNLVQTFPNVTLIDTGILGKQIENILNQVSQAVQVLFSLTLVAGLLILYAALLSARTQRLREIALLRALGASTQQLQRTQRGEYALIGLSAGLLAATLAQILGWALATFIFQFPWQWQSWVWPLGAGSGILCALLVGEFAVREITQTRPIQVLRDIT